MKKKIFKVMACAVVLSSVLAFTGCSDDKKEDDKKTTQSDDAEKTTKDDTDDSDAEDTGTDSDSSILMYDSMEEFVNSEELQAQLEALKSSLVGTGMDVDIEADGSRLVYKYTYAEVEKSDEMVAALESGIESEKETFQSVVESLKDEVKVNVDELVVEVQYIDCNGEIIYSEEFTAE